MRTLHRVLTPESEYTFKNYRPNSNPKTLKTQNKALLSKHIRVMYQTKEFLYLKSKYTFYLQKMSKYFWFNQPKIKINALS